MSDMSLPHDPLSPDMPPTSPITLVHSRRRIAGIAAYLAFLVIGFSAFSWHQDGLYTALVGAAAMALACALVILYYARIRLRYGPGLPLDYRPSLGRSLVIPLDSILSWTLIVGGLPPRHMVRLVIRPAPDAPTRTVTIVVPGRLEDFERFDAFLCSILPPPPHDPPPAR
ncbi:MAG: hypothetical protein ILO10_00025 [Kiritimatiellae bacterium]|nr:hypothetical protein [Kiritimatiellia bacterium]